MGRGTRVTAAPQRHGRSRFCWPPGRSAGRGNHRRPSISTFSTGCARRLRSPGRRSETPSGKAPGHRGNQSWRGIQHRGRPGEAVAIMTGAAAPSGANAVVMVEHTRREDERVEVLRAVEAGANIVPTGSEAAVGEQLLIPGMAVDHAAIAVAASVGKSVVKVFSKPRVAILATGDEIVGINAQPGQEPSHTEPTAIRSRRRFRRQAAIQYCCRLLPMNPYAFEISSCRACKLTCCSWQAASPWENTTWSSRFWLA